MKTKLTILALLCAFNINASGEQPASSSGSLDLSYATEHYFRGAEVGAEAIQATVAGSADLGSFKVCGSVFTNQTTASGSGNFDQVKLGIGKSFADGLLSLYAGVLNTDADDTGSELDVFIGGKIDTVLSPVVIVYRNSDDDLFTYEGSLSHTVETSIVDLSVSVSGGITDVTASDERSYYGAGLELSREIGSIKPHVGVDYVNADDSDDDTIVSAGLTFQF